uniref:Uncharacterized protein n=1 Tax=CrAss-like virus sp. ctRQZ5 TaxID=2826824 RepID=A0A8S5LXU5_9CAUD|nr:MAG TPA: hypothetical protein [CrAss-like virus sp. ctRQZ5]DAR70466.1 MAG TPA: hypothetical protein [Caudoviricetes sp.]
MVSSLGIVIIKRNSLSNIIYVIVGIIADGIGNSLSGSKQALSSVGSSAITSTLIYSS